MVKLRRKGRPGPRRRHPRRPAVWRRRVDGRVYRRVLHRPDDARRGEGGSVLLRPSVRVGRDRRLPAGRSAGVPVHEGRDARAVRPRPVHPAGWDLRGRVRLVRRGRRAAVLRPPRVPDVKAMITF